MMKEMEVIFRHFFVCLVLCWGLCGCNAAINQRVEERSDAAGRGVVSSEVISEPEVLNNGAVEKLESDLGVEEVEEKFFYHAKLETSAGVLCCDLFGEQFPISVYHFVHLARGDFDMLSESEGAVKGPYYDGQSFYRREKGNFIVTGHWDQHASGGLDYRLVEESLKLNAKAGMLGYVQLHPGANSGELILLARDIPLFDGVYTFFGQCNSVELIDALSKSKEAFLKRIEIVEGKRCDGGLEMLKVSEEGVIREIVESEELLEEKVGGEGCPESVKMGEHSEE